MDTFSHFKIKLDSLLRSSARAQLFFDEPYCANIEFNSIEVKSGATRCCLIDKNWNTVVKFAYYNEEDGPCDREIDHFENAVENGVEKYFAKAQYIGKYCYKGYGYSPLDVNITLEDKSEEEIREFIENEEIEKTLISITLYLYEYPKAVMFNRARYTPSKEVSELIEENSPLTKYDTRQNLLKNMEFRSIKG